MVTAIVGQLATEQGLVLSVRSNEHAVDDVVFQVTFDDQ